MPLWVLSNWKLILGGLLAVAMSFATWRVTSWVYQGDIAKIERDQVVALDKARADAAAKQHDADLVSMKAGETQTVVQEKIVTKYIKIHDEVPIYVKDTSTCITVGLVRLLDAAALTADPADLHLNTGESNDDCAGIGSVALARSVSDNYGLAQQNAAQLTGLQDWVRAEKAIIERGPSE